jgi:hypothetical protein
MALGRGEQKGVAHIRSVLAHVSVDRDSQDLWDGQLADSVTVFQRRGSLVSSYPPAPPARREIAAQRRADSKRDREPRRGGSRRYNDRTFSAFSFATRFRRRFSWRRVPSGAPAWAGFSGWAARRRLLLSEGAAASGSGAPNSVRLQKGWGKP